MSLMSDERVVMEHMPGGKLPENAQEAYEVVLFIANKVLQKCSKLSISVLQKENPTITEIANEMREVCDLVDMMIEAGDKTDMLTPIKAKEYVAHVQAIANAIDANDEEELVRQVAALDKRSFL